MPDPDISLNDIKAILPHRPPFLFVDRVTRLAPGVSIVAERDLRPDEPHFQGHFPGRPIMPGVLVTDALAQAAGLLIGLSRKLRKDPAAQAPALMMLAAADMKYTSPSVPGETLVLAARLEREFGALFHFAVEASAGRRAVARGTLVLAEVRKGAP